jgi:hypothetical protein
MVGRIIGDYMEGRGGMHAARKLTVPGFGTFMRKDTGGGGEGRDGGNSRDDAHGEVIFVDLLRRDDGVLASLVEDYGHYSEVEAMALIDRFIFETRNNIERDGSSQIEGFGTMTLDHKGLYQFDYSPAARPATKEIAVQEELFGKEEPAAPSPEPSVTRTATAPQQQQRQQQPSPQKTEQSPRPKRRPRVDTIIILAIVAAALALAIIVWSGLPSEMPFLRNN